MYICRASKTAENQKTDVNPCGCIYKNATLESEAAKKEMTLHKMQMAGTKLSCGDDVYAKIR